MIVEALLAQLDQPDHNGHIYTTACIDDAIINNKDAKNVFVYLDSSNCPVQCTIGRALNYHIKNNCLYATVDIKDDIFTEKDRLHMGEIGTLTLDIDGVVADDYKFGMIYKFENEGEDNDKRRSVR